MRSHTIAIYPAGVDPPLEFSFSADLGIRAIRRHNFGLSAATGGTPPYTFSSRRACLRSRRHARADSRHYHRPRTSRPLAGWLLRSVGHTRALQRIGARHGRTRQRSTARSLSSFPSASCRMARSRGHRLASACSFQLTPKCGLLAFGWSATGLPTGLGINASGLISGAYRRSRNHFTNDQPHNSAPLLTTGIGFTLNVNAFAITNGGVLPNGVVGSAHSQPLLIARLRNTGCAWTVSSVPLPGGFSLTGSTGAIAGTPTGMRRQHRRSPFRPPVPTARCRKSSR